MPRHRQNGERYPSGKLKHANGGANGEPVDAIAKWVRQRKLVEAEVIDRRWGSQIGRLNRFHYLSDVETGVCFRFADLQRRASRIRGTPAPTVRAASYDPTDHVASEPSVPPVSNGEKAALEALETARRAVTRMASPAAYEPPLRCATSRPAILTAYGTSGAPLGRWHGIGAGGGSA
jgi:hypothetical protein